MHMSAFRLSLNLNGIRFHLFTIIWNNCVFTNLNHIIYICIIELNVDCCACKIYKISQPIYDVLIQSNQPLALMTLFTSQQFVRGFLGSISGLVGNELLLSASSENQLLLIS